MGKERVTQIEDMLKAGKFQTDIAAEFGVSRQRIQQVAKKLGLDYKKKPWKRREGPIPTPSAKISAEIAKEIRISYVPKMSLQELADKYDVSRGTVWSVLRGFIWKEAGGPIFDKILHPNADPEKRDKIWAMHIEGKTIKEISTTFNLSVIYISQLLKKIKKQTEKRNAQIAQQTGTPQV